MAPGPGASSQSPWAFASWPCCEVRAYGRDPRNSRGPLKLKEIDYWLGTTTTTREGRTDEEERQESSWGWGSPQVDRLVRSMGKKIELEVPSFFPLLPFLLIIYHPLIGLTNVFCLLPLTLKPGITSSGPTSCPFICVCVCVWHVTFTVHM